MARSVVYGGKCTKREAAPLLTWQERERIQLERIGTEKKAQAENIRLFYEGRRQAAAHLEPVMQQPVMQQMQQPVMQQMQQPVQLPEEGLFKEESRKRRRGFVLTNLNPKAIAQPPERHKLLTYQSLAPRKTSDLLGSSAPRDQGMMWLNSGIKWGSKPVSSEMLLICGPPGCGKTVLARALLQAGKCKIVEAPYDAEKGGLASFFRAQSTVDAAGTKLGLVVEDVDFAIQIHSAAAFSEKCPTPVVGTCLVIDRLMLSLFPKTLRLWGLPDRDCQRLVQKVNPRLSSKEAADLSSACNGDMRQVIIKSTMQYCGDKDSFLRPFAEVREVLRSPEADLSSEYSVLCIHENCLSLASEIESCARLMADFAYADANNELTTAPWLALSVHLALRGSGAEDACHLRGPKLYEHQASSLARREKLIFQFPQSSLRESALNAFKLRGTLLS